uniref:DUF2461 domain-containing protein n=1 Tax=Roseihalotalea indica TaxID=2867963 RepID=A0AA49Q015_9BACT|nr:DUF2461 domain-containing protein [Tunicatimonas sp. TK19036]
MDTAYILSFLSDLQANNEKTWMDEHRDRYQTAKQHFIELIGYMLGELSIDDESLRGLTPKDCIFRINRDIRFSKDKAPYKNNFGAAMAEGGKKTDNALYYLHLQPHNESFLAGGIYQPPKEVLAKVRQEIDYNASELKTITDAPDFKRYFDKIQGDALKRAPKGYEPDHPNIELLKLKDYLVMHKFTDAEVTDKNFPRIAVKIFHSMQPFLQYLNVAVS